VTRRPTGGGGIYHDYDGDLSYAIALPAEAAPGDLHETYDRLCEPIVTALESLGVPVHFAEEETPAIHRPACYLRALDPAHDLVGPDGRKLAGNAQFRRRDAVVQHGSLSISLRPERHCDCFDADLDPATYADRVGAIDEYVDRSRSEVVATVAETLIEWADAERGEWSDAERDRATDVAAGTFATEAWTRNREQPEP